MIQRPWRAAAASALVLGILAVTVCPASASTTSSSWAGHWSYIVEQSCTVNKDNANVCGQILGPYTASWSNWFDAYANPQGKFVFQAGFVATEDAPHAKHYCNVKIFSNDFNGSCLVTDHGKGFFKRDSKGDPYFWISSETATFHGKHITVVHDPGVSVPVPKRARRHRGLSYEI